MNISSSIVFIRPICLALLSIVLFSSEISAREALPSNVDLPAIELFADLPTYTNYSLSPSGEKLAYFLAHKGRRHLVVQNIAGGDVHVIPPWEDDLELISYFWKSDEYVVFTVVFTANRAVFRIKTTETRTISMHLPTRKVVWLGKPKRSRGTEFVSQIESIVDRMVDEPEQVLIALDLELDGYPSVYSVNLRTGHRVVIQQQKSGVNQWYSDHNSKVRLGLGYQVKRSGLNVYFKGESNKWIKLSKGGRFDNYSFIGFSNNINQIYVTGATSHGTQGVFLLDVLTGETVNEVYANKQVDMGNVIFHPVSGHMIGVGYMDDFYRQEFFESKYKTIKHKLDKPFPGEVVSIVGSARDKPLYLILVESDVNTGEYYLYNESTSKLDWFSSVRPNLPKALSSPTQRIDIPVRDGSVIPAYLTSPLGVKTDGLPTVILPHGGPWARDNQTWDFWAQFYASRGYLVLKPNFRGSTGYGDAFRELGEQQWGGLMQQDVTDATQWLISEGFSDPERICIVGASYGGYAALMGVVMEPGLYACAVSINGATNLPKLKSSDKRNGLGGLDWTKKMGLKGTKDKQVSPYHQANRINTPVLLMSSKDDARIPYKHSIQLHKRLLKKKKQSTYVGIETGSHYMLNAESRLTMLKATESFLKLHLSPAN